jgi:hypothetical protein
MLKIGAILWILATVFTIVPLIFGWYSIFSDNILYYMFATSFALWGIVYGFIALFSNSVADGMERTKYFSWLLGSSLGPLVSIILFNYFGDEWSRSTMIIIWLISMGVLFFRIPLTIFRDVVKGQGRR